MVFERTQSNECFNKFRSGDFGREKWRIWPTIEKVSRRRTELVLQALLDEDGSEIQEIQAKQLNITQKTFNLRLKATGLVFLKRCMIWLKDNKCTKKSPMKFCFKKKSVLLRIITNDEK